MRLNRTRFLSTLEYRIKPLDKYKKFFGGEEMLEYKYMVR